VGVEKFVEGMGAGGAVRVRCSVDVDVHAARGDVERRTRSLGVKRYEGEKQDEMEFS
jgi:hypothetical protein